MLEEKYRDLIVYISILITPLLYMLILGLLVIYENESKSFSDYYFAISIYFIGMITTYIPSIIYVLKAMKTEIAKENVIIALSVFHIPVLIAMTYFILVISENM